MKRLRRELKTAVQRMMLRRSGCLFIDIPRTSTTSIKSELAEQLGPIFSKYGGSRWAFADHVPAVEMRQILGQDLWGRLFKFSIVRNPFSRQISYYQWATANGYLKGFSFREFIMEIGIQFDTGRSRFSWHGPWASNCFYVTDESGCLIVDFVVKFEYRVRGLMDISERLGRELGEIHSNRHSSPGTHYSEYYDDEMIALMNRVYSSDLQLFGYSFESDSPCD